MMTQTFKEFYYLGNALNDNSGFKVTVLAKKESDGQDSKNVEKFHMEKSFFE